MNLEITPVKNRDLNKSQRGAVSRILRFYRDHNDYSKVTSVRFELSQCGSCTFVLFDTRRSDCDKYSQRQVLCQQHGHFAIGVRGGIKVINARDGLTERRQSTARAIGCSVSNY